MGSEYVFEDSTVGENPSYLLAQNTRRRITEKSSIALKLLRAAAPPPASIRVCPPCADSISRVAVIRATPLKEKKLEDVVKDTPVCVYALYPRTEELYIGSLSVVCIQARDLAGSNGQGLTNPYVALTLTGYTLSRGQEWPKTMRTGRKTSPRYATLDPVWGGEERFYLRVPRAEAVLRLEMCDWGLGVTDGSLGQAEIPLANLLHQRKVDCWVPLASSSGRGGAGEVRLVLQYKFNRAGEVFSRFWPEPPCVKELPEFSLPRTYKHITDLVEDSKPLMELLHWARRVLDWEHPAETLFVYGVVVALTLSPRYVFSFLHLVLLRYVLLAWVARQGRQHERDVAETAEKSMTVRALLRKRRQEGRGLLGRLLSTPMEGRRRRRTSSQGGTGGSSFGASIKGDACQSGGGGRDLIEEVAKAGGGVEVRGENQNEREDLDEQKDIRSLGLILSTLEARLGQREATRTLQHALGMLVSLLQSVRHLLEWEEPISTAIFAFVLGVSTVTHVFVSVTWLVLIVEAALFRILTWPLQAGRWVAVRIVRSALSLTAQAHFAWSGCRMGPGQVLVDD